MNALAPAHFSLKWWLIVLLCYHQPFDTISWNHKELFLSRFCKLHSIGSHFACDLLSSIVLLQQELFHGSYCSSTAEPERPWKPSSLTSLMCPIKELMTTFPVRPVLFYSHKHLHLFVSVKAAKCCKRCGSFGKVWEWSLAVKWEQSRAGCRKYLLFVWHASMFSDF